MTGHRLVIGEAGGPAAQLHIREDQLDAPANARSELRRLLPLVPVSVRDWRSHGYRSLRRQPAVPPPRLVKAHLPGAAKRARRDVDIARPAGRSDRPGHGAAAVWREDGEPHALAGPGGDPRSGFSGHVSHVESLAQTRLVRGHRRSGQADLLSETVSAPRRTDVGRREASEEERPGAAAPPTRRSDPSPLRAEHGTRPSPETALGLGPAPPTDG
jgi:hypothetical protein